MSLFDIKTLFDCKSKLREMADDLKMAQDQQHLSLQKLNQMQDAIFFEEICWQTHRCYFKLKNSEHAAGSKKIIQHMVRSMLIECYGPAATQLQLLLK